MRCYYCGYEGSHDPHCPSHSPKDSEQYSSFWRGNRDGKARRENAEPNNPAYRLGWIQGDSEADYAENVRPEDYHC